MRNVTFGVGFAAAIIAGCVQLRATDEHILSLPAKPTVAVQPFYVTPKEPLREAANKSARAAQVATAAPSTSTPLATPASSAVPAASSVAGEGVQLQLAKSLTITGYATAQILPDHAAASRIVAMVPAAINAKAVTVKGFTDSTGDASKNVNLAIARADRVRQMLVANGVDRSKIRVEYCSTCYVATNTTEDGRQRNRRVEVTLVRGARVAQRDASGEGVVIAMAH